MTGGSDVETPYPTIRDRIRALLDSQVLPRNVPEILAGRSLDGGRCVGCGETISIGDIEYEIIAAPGAGFRLHHHCVQVWADEAAE